MKKSLSAIVSLSLVFSVITMGAAVSAKSSNDFTDLKDLDPAVKMKFDSMIASGIFDGVSESSFGLKDKMNRAQFAKVAALIFGLKVDNSLKTSTFSDVRADDPANGYALPYIEAIVKAGITDGFAPGQYNPAGEVTKEQLAAFLLRGLSMDTQARATSAINDSTVSTWAKGYVALAVQLKLLTPGTDGTIGGTMAAARDLLVLASYEAKSQYKPVFNGRFGIASFKATDSNALVVQLNGAVPDTKLVKLNVTRNGTPVTNGYTTTWSADQTTATLTFENKLNDANWKVTLEGLTSLDEAAKTAQFTTTQERIASIELLTAGDTLPNDRRIRIDFKAANQYGGKSSLSASNFNIYTSKGTVTAIGGEQAFYLDLPEGLTRGEALSITIIHESSGTQGNKVFKIGDKRLISKLEVGDVINDAGSKLDSISSKGYGYLDVKAYDQYGLRVENKADLNSGITVVTNDSDLEKGNPGDTGAFIDSVVGDSAADLKLRSISDRTKDITVTLYANGSGQSVTKTVKIAAASVASSVAFGPYTYSLSKGDMPTGDENADAKFYIPIVVKDSQGNQLTAQQIYDQRDKFIVTSNGGVTLSADPISGSGSHKGMIAIKSVNSKDNSIVTIQLKDSSIARAELTLSGNDERKADGIRFSVMPAKYMTAGTSNELKVKLYDQFGGELKYDPNNQYVVRYSLKANAGDAASLSATRLASRQRVDQANSSSARKYVLQPQSTSQEVTLDFKLARDSSDASVDSVFDKAFNFYTDSTAKAASYTFKATLLKADTNGSVTSNGVKYVEVNSVSTTVEIIDPNDTNSNLTYEAYLDRSTNTLLAADDYLSAGSGAAGAANVYDNYRGFGKEIRVRAKRANGDEVKVPTSIVSVSSSNTQVADVASRSADSNGARYVAGGKAGAAKLSVLFNNGKNEIVTGYIDVTAKNEGPTVSGITLNKTGKDVNLSDLQAGLYLWDAKLAEKITVKDQYGGEFTAEQAPGSLSEEGTINDNYLIKTNGAGFNNNEVLKISFYLSNVVGTTASAVTVDSKTGLIKYTGAAGNVTSFRVNAVAPSGQSAAFDVNVK